LNELWRFILALGKQVLEAKGYGIMATHLSWTGYLLAVSAAVAIYYVIIGLNKKSAL
jgi:hypothetical protein